MSIRDAIAGAFRRWVNTSREELEKRMSSQPLDERRIQAILDDVFSETRRSFIEGMGPAVYHSYLEGAVEAGYGMDQKAIANLAYNYAGQVADYANQMSSEAAAEAYIGALKRKQQPKQAFDFMRRAFGVDRRAVKSLLKQLENEEIKDYSVKQRPSQKKANMDAYIAATVQRRANMFGDEEGYASKQMSKALVWNLAATQGVLPKDATKSWFTVRDERTCKVCGPMHNQTVGLTDKFRQPDGKMIWAPAIHIRCRCEVKLNIPTKVKQPKPSGLKGAFAKSNDNQWRTQPRSGDGRFGERPGSKHKPLYNSSSLYQGKVTPRRGSTAVLERPTAPSQTSVDAQFDQLITSMYSMPQLSPLEMTEDNDVMAALETITPKDEPVTFIQNEAVSFIKTNPISLVKPVHFTETRIDPVVSMENIAATASLVQLRTVHLNDVHMTPVERVDIKQEIIAAAPEKIKLEVEAELEKEENQVINRTGGDVPPLYVIIPRDTDGSLAPGTSFTSDPYDLVDNIVDEYQAKAAEAMRRYQDELSGEFGMDDWDIQEAFEYVAKEMAYEAIENLGLPGTRDAYGDNPVEPISDYDRIKFENVLDHIDIHREIGDTAAPYILRADTTHMEKMDDHNVNGEVFAVANSDIKFHPNGDKIVFEWDEGYDENYWANLEPSDTSEDDEADPSWYEGESYE